MMGAKKNPTPFFKEHLSYNNISIYQYVDYLEQTNGVFLGFKDAKMGVANGHSA